VNDYENSVYPRQPGNAFGPPLQIYQLEKGAGE